MKNESNQFLHIIMHRYEVYMDENGDAEGNYTLVSRQLNASKVYGLFPAGRFTKLRNLTANPVNFFWIFFSFM